jgi:hypothetical protein
MTWTPEDIKELGDRWAAAHVGYFDGRRELSLSRQYVSPHYRELAAEHELARKRLNGLLPPAEYRRHRFEGVTFLGDHMPFRSEPVQAALEAYRDSCLRAMLAPKPTPRRILDMIRCAAELLDAPDPVHSGARYGVHLNRTDFVMCGLFDKVRSALSAAGID